MTSILPDSVVKFAEDCKVTINDYVVKPGKFLGKSLVYIITPREMEKNENKYAYVAKEAVVTVAKVIVIVAAVYLIKASLIFAVFAAAAALIFVGGRYKQVEQEAATYPKEDNSLIKYAKRCLLAYGDHMVK